MDSKIDFVITWVDGSDSKWIESKNKELEKINKEKIDSRNNRYRDMECLKYWFRSIEKNAPWVNKIYFVTCGQKPEWLNESNPKLVLVNHEDYMPKEYLPTFNSNAIEQGMHRIKGLSEKFVYFNDDMFILNKVNEEDFFIDNKPCDTMLFHPVNPNSSDKKFYVKICNDIEIINKHFDFNEYKKKYKKLILSPKLGKKVIINYLFTKYSSFKGFYMHHGPISFLKSTYEEVWSKEPEILNKTMSFKFRNNIESINLCIFQYWQFATGNFIQRKETFNKYLNIATDNIEEVLTNKKIKSVCLNDVVDSDEEFNIIKNKIIDLFEKRFPEKSSFEK